MTDSQKNLEVLCGRVGKSIGMQEQGSWLMFLEFWCFNNGFDFIYKASLNYKNFFEGFVNDDQMVFEVS